jgi:cell division protein ZipA
MNELRWILLAAGVILIAALYLWGMRSRWQGRGDTDGSRRPAVFTGGAQGFETQLEEAIDADAVDEPAVLRADARRIEPSFGSTDSFDAEIDLDDDAPDAPPPQRRAAILDDEIELERPALARREPTLSSVRTEPSVSLSRAEPTLHVEPVAPARRVEPAAAPETASKTGRAPQKIIAIRVTALAPARFDGAELLKSLREEGLGFGRYEIFHHLHDDGRPIFSVASLREPGTFDIESMAMTQYPGVAMFAVLPGPVPAADAFDDMIFTARALATYLNGALADERGAPLTALRVGKLREEALEFERSAGQA